MATRELIGKIIIEENIDTVNQNNLPKTFVINVPDPFKNYYDRFTEVTKPTSIIFVTKTPNSFEKILRATNKINKKYNVQLHGAKSEVKVGSRSINGVRIKGIENYMDIGKFQQYYKDEGFEFAKEEKFQNVDSLIRINRFFKIKKMDTGIYHSKDEENVYYIEIPKYINWANFKKFTIEIKNNMPDKNYDIAKGILYKNDGIIEILRIVKPKASLEMLKTLQKKYIEKL